MRFLILMLLLFFIVLPAPGQSDYRIIGTSNRITASIDADYYIQSIEDERPFRANLGIINRGARKNIKRQLIPESTFFPNLLERMDSWLKRATEAEPVVVMVRELYFWESHWMNSERGYIRLELAFVESSGEKETVVAVELSGEEVTVSKGHSTRLEMAFFRCLQEYDAKRKDQAEAVVLAAVGRPVTDKGGLLAARNFLSLWKGNLFSATGNLQNKGRLYRYQLYRGGQEAGYPYYAVVKKNRLFLWAGSYPGIGRHYTQVLEQGRYLFLIDEILIQQGSELQVELSQSSNKVGIVIDMETGAPQIVDDKLMERLMRPYPALQEKYLFKDILKFPFQLTRVQNVIAEINRLEAER